MESPNGTLSELCALCTEEHFHQYNYYETLNEYYSYFYGNPLGPTQRVGFSNELITRLTYQPVHDETSSNHTLDSSNAAFPFSRRLYADFSHDDDMKAIFSDLGLSYGTGPFVKHHRDRSASKRTAVALPRPSRSLPVRTLRRCHVTGRATSLFV